MAPNIPSELGVPFSQVNRLKKMASKNAALPGKTCFGAIFSRIFRKTPRDFTLAKFYILFSLFYQKMAPKERIAGQSLFYGAIFFKPSTWEKGTRRSEGVFEAIFCAFGAIFFIFGAIFLFCKWLRKWLRNCFVHAKYQILHIFTLYERCFI